MDSSDNPVAGWMLFLLFIVINSIFYGFGSAIQNLNENEIEDKAEQGDKKSKLLLHIMNAPGSLIQTVQFYHMLLSFLVGYVQLKSIMKTVSVSLSATAAGVFFTENPGKIILCILVLFVDLILLATFGTDWYQKESALDMQQLPLIGWYIWCRQVLFWPGRLQN